MVFDDAWFARHQQALLKLLNHWATRRWFRWVLCIRPYDIGYVGVIVELRPNSYTVLHRWRPDGGADVTTDFRTHAKFAKRLYTAFLPIWLALHAFDWAIADRWCPRLSFGFLTLTAFPDAGNPGSATVDGSLYRINAGGESWSTLIAGAGTSVSGAITDDVYFEFIAHTTSGNWTRLVRSIFHFDTSALGSSASISAATLSLFGQYKADPGSNTPDTNIYSSTVTSNTTLAASDFSQVGSTAFATAIGFSSFSTTAYNDFTLNASGISNISLTGVSKFSARNANYDAAAASPTWSSGIDSYCGGFYADQTGTTNDPKLVVTYTAGSASGKFGTARMLMGVGA